MHHVNVNVSILFILLSFLSTHIDAERSRNPCHPGRSSSVLGSNCEYIRLPYALCNNCKLNGYDSSGYFNRCDAIYNINNPKCKFGIRRYVQLNPCDTIRKKQLQSFNSRDSQFALDYFVYSICEECCDCIPDGSRKEQFLSRLKGNKLISYVRGNCPAHAHYDVCRVWPKVRDVARPGQPFIRNRPQICPIILQWFRSPNSRNWSGNNNTKFSKSILEFLQRLVKAARCESKGTWQMCVGLEKAQSRV